MTDPITSAFAPNAPSFRKAMIAYIKEHFADVLGPHADLLDEEGGLDKVATLLADGKLGRFG